MEAGKYRAFQGRLNSRSEPRAKLVAKTPNPQVLARVSLLASHERLREKRLCLAGVQAIKSRFFAPIYRKYLYILSYPVFLYYAESPKVPPRVFGPLGPKTLRGQKPINIFDHVLMVNSRCYDRCYVEKLILLCTFLKFHTYLVEN